MREEAGAAAVRVLQAALAAEHAVIWGYGVVGAHLSGGALRRARAAEATHRARRNSVRLTLRARGANPVPAAATYRLPFAVDGPGSALRLAVHLEAGDADAWDAVLTATAAEAALRREALTALTDAAVRAAHWRLLAARSGPATVTFPGRPTR